MKYLFTGSFLFILSVLVYHRCSPIREFKKIPVYEGKTDFSYPLPPYDPGRKNVFLIAYNKGTEIFDLMAPFYLFNLTGKANVFIIAPEKRPVAIMKGFFVLPHFSFREIDSLQIDPAVIVIPNLSAMDKKKQDPELIAWIKAKHSGSSKMLAVCAGSVTAASTGFYNGIEMTTHASELEDNKKQFMDPVWIAGKSFTKSGNLYSTAGVSNAVEGSLSVISDLFGKEIMEMVMESIHYPHSSLKTGHQSLPITGSDKAAIFKKAVFKKSPHIGVLLQDNIDEFALSAVLDSYHRTFPSSLQTFAANPGPVITRFGLKLLPTGRLTDIKDLDEIHVLSKETLSRSEQTLIAALPAVIYPPDNKEYIFDACLKRISVQYGSRVLGIVKRLLDYN